MKARELTGAAYKARTGLRAQWLGMRAVYAGYREGKYGRLASAWHALAWLFGRI